MLFSIIAQNILYISSAYDLALLQVRMVLGSKDNTDGSHNLKIMSSCVGKMNE